MKRLKRIVLIVIVLVLIGPILPNSSEKDSKEDAEGTVLKTDNSEESDEMEDSVEPEIPDTQEEPEEEKEDVFFTKERSVNEVINKYNERYPDDLVEPDMVEFWMAGGGNYATTVDFDDFQIEFNEGDGDDMYDFRSDMDINAENKEYFINRSLKWMAVIFELTDDQIEEIHNILMKKKSEIDLEFTSGSYGNYRQRVNYEENGRDYRLDYYNYLIFIHPLRW